MKSKRYYGNPDFPIETNFFGILLFLLGLFAAIITWKLGLGLILVGFCILLNFKGLEMNFKERKYRQFRQYLFYRFLTDWNILNSSSDFVLIQNCERIPYEFSTGGYGHFITKRTSLAFYGVTTTDFLDRKELLFEFGSYAEALQTGHDWAEKLDKKLEDRYDQVVSEQIKNRKR